MLKTNYLALILTFAAALLWLRLNDFAAHKGWIESRLSRKIIHIGTGPIYVLCWLLFPGDPTSRYWAATVPLLITVQFFLVGMGILKDEAAVKAMSRTGDRREILHGPLYYGVIFVLITIVYWYDSPIGIVALMVLCGGDGLADILGTRFGSTKLPWSDTKTWVGSLGMFLGSWILSILILIPFISQDVFAYSLTDLFLPITLISIGATAIESLPLREIDNITVSLTALVLGHILIK